jgi:hypothetical protein
MLAPAENSRTMVPLLEALWANGTLCRSSGDWQNARRFLTSDSVNTLDVTRSNTDLAVINHQLGDLIEGGANVETLLENPPAGVT